MGLFGRRTRATPDPEPADTEPADTEPAGPEPVDTRVDLELEDPEVDTTHASGLEDTEADELTHRDDGPWDVEEVDGLAGRIDLGSLWVAPVEGLQLALEVEEATQAIVGARLILGASLAHVQAYAAPRTTGIWPQIRAEIAQTVSTQGGRTQVVDGVFGRELLATPTGGQPMRFLGIDGPRWFLRVVLSGPAATDEGAAAPLVDLVRGLVVVRGSEAKPPRELLPLQLPPQPAAPTDGTTPDGANPDGATPDGATPDGAGSDGAGSDGSLESSPRGSGPSGRRSLDDLRPFERGPEITEVR